MVRSGIIQGYLAYDSDLAIGWCNANDRLNYYRVGEFDMDNIPEDASNSVYEKCRQPNNRSQIKIKELMTFNLTN